MNKDRYAKWSKLDIDATDHYCIAAQLAVYAFFKSAAADVEIPPMDRP